MKYALALFTVLFTFSAQADIDNGSCYSLYMQPGANDPAKACIRYNPETGIAASVDLFLITGELKDNIRLESSEYRSPSGPGSLFLHYYNLRGTGQFHRASASQNHGVLSLMSLTVYSLIDGHSQKTVEFSSRTPKPPRGCNGRGRCI
jgi:hypothetical protein